MKKNKTLTIKTILSFAAATLFLACSNLGGGSVSNGAGGPNAAGGQGGAQAPVMVTVNGSLAFGGAYPAQIAALVENSGADGLDGIARSAFPDAASSGLTYSVYALEDLPAGSTDTPLRYEGTVAVDKKSYTVGIPVLTGKKYNVFAEVKNGGITVLSGQSAKVIEAPSGESSFVTDANITLAATQTATGTGLVSLAVGDPDQKAVSACVCYKVGSTDYKKNLTQSGSGTDTVWTLGIGEIKTNAGTGQKYIDSGIKSGAHLMTFEFYSEADRGGTLLYSFTEAVNVFDNMTTNKWVKNGGEPWLTPDSSGNIACKITAAMVTGFGLTDIYVDPSAANDSGSGSYFNPKKTFASAVAMLQNPNAEYTIYIKGTVEEGQTIPSTISAKSLTLCGATPLPTTGANKGIPQDIIDAGGADGKSALFIETAVPITIENLKITGGMGAVDGGYAYGGGICLKAEGGSLTLASGAYVSENQAKAASVTNKGRGAGICLYPACRLNILDGAVIEKNESEGGGGGIYCNSTFAKKAVITMSGGHIRGNAAVNNGGGNAAVNFGGALHMGYGTFTMTGGVIGDDSTSIIQAAKYGDDERKSPYSNTARLGGAIYSFGSGSGSFNIYLLGGTIAYNYAERAGGAIHLYYGNMTVKNAKIQYNGAGDETGGLAAVGYGGALYFERYGDLHLEDCSIIGNECYECVGGEAKGGAICVLGPSDASTTPNIYLKGSVSIPSDRKLKNDICLQKSSSSWEYPALTIEGKLTGSGKIARLTPTTDDYDVMRVVLKLASGVTDTTLAEAACKFAVTPQTSPAQDWTVGSDGKLCKVTPVTSTNISSLSFSDSINYVLRADSSLSVDSNYESLMNKLDGIADPGEIVLDLSKTNDIFKGITYPKELSKNISVVVMPENATTFSPRCIQVGNPYTDMKLKEIIVPEDNAYFCSENGVLYNKNKTKLLRYPPAKTDATFTLPNTVTALAEGAFYGCPNITQVTNLSQITTLSNMVNEFFYCTSLTTANLRGVTGSTLTQNIFRACTSLKTVYLSSNISTFGQNCFYGCSALEEIHFARSTPPYLDYDNFKNCPSSITFYVPSGSKSAYLNDTSAHGFTSSYNPWANLNNFADMIDEE
ncbi:MAG: leucine-rich repeat domain-containing protein [Treponema sp.]|nr:leucine-rich repeat domain-containing protein [Treponema sp.]